MDSDRFDHLSKHLSTRGTRRGLLRRFATVPVVGGLLTRLVTVVQGQGNGAVVGGGGGRRRRRRARHRHDPGQHKDTHKEKRKRCRPKPDATTCAGKCGTVRNNCGKRVDCGSCACTPACPLCHTCDAATTQCVPSPNRSRCGGSGQAASVCCNGSCCAGCCGRDGTCGACLVFVSGTTHDGNLGGLSGADAICQQQAQAAVPSLPGTYMAWLSDDTGSPSTRFRCTEASCSAQGYRLVDGTVVADDWADLTDGQVDVPINRTPQNEPFVTAVWTQTRPDGTEGGELPDAHCNNWSSGIDGGTRPGGTGTNSFSDDRWTQRTITGCHVNRVATLYCFQQS